MEMVKGWLTSSAIGRPISRPSLPVALVRPARPGAVNPLESTLRPLAAERNVNSPGVLERYVVRIALQFKAMSVQCKQLSRLRHMIIAGASIRENEHEPQWTARGMIESENPGGGIFIRERGGQRPRSIVPQPDHLLRRAPRQNPDLAP